MTEKHFDVVALGELLVDFTDNGLSSQGNTLFEANHGGATCLASSFGPWRSRRVSAWTIWQWTGRHAPLWPL